MAQKNTNAAGARAPLDEAWLATKDIEDCISDVTGNVYLCPNPQPLDKLAQKLEKEVSTESSSKIEDAVEELVHHYTEYRFRQTDGDTQVKLAEDKLRSLIGSEKTALADEAVRTIYREVDAKIKEYYPLAEGRAHS